MQDPDRNSEAVKMIVRSLKDAYADELLSGKEIRPLDLQFDFHGQKFVLQILEGTDLREFIKDLTD